VARTSGVLLWGEKDVKLYSAPLSLFARKVEIALREKDLAFERVMVPFSQERGYAPKHPDVLAANPKGQVPVLVDGDLALFDSTVILEYLEDAFPDPPLYPASPRARAECRLLELFADEVLLVDVRRLMYRSEPPAGDAQRRTRLEEDGRQGEAALRWRWAELEGRLEGRDWFAASFSAADIALFMAVLFARRLHGPSLDGFPALCTWFTRASERPSVQPAVAEIAAADLALSPALARWSPG
jgi:glutathione S-transferase